MYLLAKFNCHRPYGNGDINFYINFSMITSSEAELTSSARDIERFSISGIPIYNVEIPGMACRNTRRKTQAKYHAFHANATTRTHAVAKRYAFHANNKWGSIKIFQKINI